ncbi:hypothetical protein BLNAU_6963 [Blattamonas nauphoetae]|uniref:Uncharacterized protein n=1 Tax=Blattamonas nauphoetae TaxID=2049346 RepID=A0ABQ9Y2R3_9EUKA|nr:hypothetical protein BLNAU_6963 [Blattamonas nauphoetae]
MTQVYPTAQSSVDDITSQLPKQIEDTLLEQLHIFQKGDPEQKVNSANHLHSLVVSQPDYQTKISLFLIQKGSIECLINVIFQSCPPQLFVPIISLFEAISSCFSPVPKKHVSGVIPTLICLSWCPDPVVSIHSLRALHVLCDILFETNQIQPILLNGIPEELCRHVQDSSPPSLQSESIDILGSLCAGFHKQVDIMTSSDPREPERKRIKHSLKLIRNTLVSLLTVTEQREHELDILSRRSKTQTQHYLSEEHQSSLPEISSALSPHSNIFEQCSIILTTYFPETFNTDQVVTLPSFSYPHSKHILPLDNRGEDGKRDEHKNALDEIRGMMQTLISFEEQRRRKDEKKLRRKKMMNIRDENPFRMQESVTDLATDPINDLESKRKEIAFQEDQKRKMEELQRQQERYDYLLKLSAHFEEKQKTVSNDIEILKSQNSQRMKQIASLRATIAEKKKVRAEEAEKLQKEISRDERDDTDSDEPEPISPERVKQKLFGATTREDPFRDTQSQPKHAQTELSAPDITPTLTQNPIQAEKEGVLKGINAFPHFAPEIYQFKGDTLVKTGTYRGTISSGVFDRCICQLSLVAGTLTDSALVGLYPAHCIEDVRRVSFGLMTDSLALGLCSQTVHNQYRRFVDAHSPVGPNQKVVIEVNTLSDELEERSMTYSIDGKVQPTKVVGIPKPFRFAISLKISASYMTDLKITELRKPELTGFKKLAAMQSVTISKNRLRMKLLDQQDPDRSKKGTMTPILVKKEQSNVTPIKKDRTTPTKSKKEASTPRQTKTEQSSLDLTKREHEDDDPFSFNTQQLPETTSLFRYYSKVKYRITPREIIAQTSLAGTLLTSSFNKASVEIKFRVKTMTGSIIVGIFAQYSRERLPNDIFVRVQGGAGFYISGAMMNGGHRRENPHPAARVGDVCKLYVNTKSSKARERFICLWVGGRLAPLGFCRIPEKFHIALAMQYTENSVEILSVGEVPVKTGLKFEKLHPCFEFGTKEEIQRDKDQIRKEMELELAAGVTKQRPLPKPRLSVQNLVIDEESETPDSPPPKELPEQEGSKLTEIPQPQIVLALPSTPEPLPDETITQTTIQPPEPTDTSSPPASPTHSSLTQTTTSSSPPPPTPPPSNPTNPLLPPPPPRLIQRPPKSPLVPRQQKSPMKHASIFEFYNPAFFSYKNRWLSKLASGSNSAVSIEFQRKIARLYFGVGTITATANFGIIKTELAEKALETNQAYLQGGIGYSLFHQSTISNTTQFQPTHQKLVKGDKCILEVDTRSDRPEERTMCLSVNGVAQPVCFSHIPMTIRFAVAIMKKGDYLEIEKVEKGGTEKKVMGHMHTIPFPSGGSQTEGGEQQIQVKVEEGTKPSWQGFDLLFGSTRKSVNVVPSQNTNSQDSTQNTQVLQSTNPDPTQTPESN